MILNLKSSYIVKELFFYKVTFQREVVAIFGGNDAFSTDEK